MLQNNHNAQHMQQNENMTQQYQFGGHELCDAHEAISSLLNSLDHYTLYENQIQDQKLLDILQRQKTFLTQMYNTVVEVFHTGNEPTVKTQTYNMMTGTSMSYGMQPTTPKSPIQTATEIDDECLSEGMMSHMKTLASDFTLAALESTNPVLRRVFADSIPNIIEMAYELFIYQNKNGYYELPMLNKQDMQVIVNSFSASQNNLQ